MKGYEAGFDIVKESFKVIGAHKKIIVPFIFVAVLLAAITLYLKFFFPWDDLNFPEILIACFVVIFVYAFLLSFSCAVLLRLISQIEAGEKVSLLKAFALSFFNDSFKITPLVLVWALAWFVIALIEAFILALISTITGAGRRYSSSSYSASGAALTLAGGVSDSVPEAATRTFFGLIQRGIRMIIFLILPGIVWERLGFVEAIKKGLMIFRTKLAPFATGYAFIWIICFALMVPPAIVIFSSGILEETHRISAPSGSIEALAQEYYDNYCRMTPEQRVLFDKASPSGGLTCPEPSAFSDLKEGKYPDFVWYLVIVYIILVWAAAIYFEQMFSALLYLWHLKWEQASADAKKQNKPEPSFEDIDPPHILDEVRDANYL